MEWAEGGETWAYERDLAPGGAGPNIVQWLRTIDRFMDSDVEVLADFLSQDAQHRAFFGDGADRDGTCGFTAIGIALSLLGMANMVTKSAVVENANLLLGQTRWKIDVLESATYPQLRGFVRTLQLGAVEVNL